jgi:hypothetical protein
VERIASAPMTARLGSWGRRFGALGSVAAVAVALRLVCGVAFANYDTLYALAWGGQLARGQTPAYGVPIAPTPHPLVEILGIVLYPLGPRTSEDVVVALGFAALAGCGWAIYRLGAIWFGRAAGLLAGLLFLTRTPVLSDGVRAYIDLPYLFLVLAAALVEARRPRAGAPVLWLLALAGLLRPEAWAFSGIYWLYVADALPWLRERLRHRRSPAPAGRVPPPARGLSGLRLAGLAGIVASAPLVWILSDLAITGDALWSLTNTRHTAETLHRETGIANVPVYIPKRLGEILRAPVLVGAALGGVLSLLWLRRRALPAAVVGVLAVLVFAAFATLGLPINTRYAFLAAAMLCIFCGAGVFGWMDLPVGDRRRRQWLVAGTVVLVALIAFAPSAYDGASREMGKLAPEQRIEDELVSLVHSGAITLRCGPVGVPNHAPVPLLALYMKASPARIVSPEAGHIASGVYVDPASREVEDDYVLDKNDPHERVSVPPGFTEVASNRSWRIFRRCG